MEPRLLFSYEERLPPGVSYWFINEDDKIRIFSNAIKTPRIYITPNNITIKGEWIYRNGAYVIRKSGEKKNTEKNEEKEDRISYSDDNIVDFAFVKNAVLTIEKDGKDFIYNGEKFTKYNHKYGFIVLENKNKFIILVNGKEIEQERPKFYKITPSFISLVYNDESVVVDINGTTVEQFRKPFYFLGRSSHGALFQIPTGESAGKIISENNPDLSTYCNGDALYIGESVLGVIISCNKQLKYYDGNAWTVITNTPNVNANFANNEFIIVTDTGLKVYPGDSVSKPLFTIPTLMNAVYADNRYIYLISESKKVYVIEADEDYSPFDIKRDKFGMISLSIDKVLYPSLKVGRGLLQTKEREDNQKIFIRIEPTRLSTVTESKIEIDNEIVRYVENIKINNAIAELEPIESYIIVSEGGTVKNREGNYNALLRVRIKYKIPTKIQSFLKVKIRGKEYYFEVDRDKFEDDRVLDIPLIKTDLRDEMIEVSLERNGYTEVSKEFPVKVKEVVKNNQDYKTYEEIENVTRRVIRKAEEGFFEWKKVWEYQDTDIYDNIIITKAGNILDIEGKNFEVKPGIQTFTAQRDFYKRDYIIYGIDSPIRGIRALVDKNKLYLDVSLDYKAPVTVIYGTQMQSSNDGRFVFSYDPFYSTIIVKVYYSETIKWTYLYQINNNDRLSIKHALSVSVSFKEFLEDKGALVND